MEDVIKVQDQFYILATSSRAGARNQVLKHGDTFAVFDHRGDLEAFGLGEQGLFHQGTRYLSTLELRFQDVRPLFLGRTDRGNNELFTVDLANPDVTMADEVRLLRGTLHILCERFLWQGTLYQRLRVANYGQHTVDVALSLHFDADFADIFEVRGMRRERRGERLPPELGSDSVTLAYHGLDGVPRRSRLYFHPEPRHLSGSMARFGLSLLPHAFQTVRLTIRCEADETQGKPKPQPDAARRADPPSKPDSFEDAWTAVESCVRLWRQQQCQLLTSSQQLNSWLGRSAADLHTMITQTEHGPYPYAGVPWFNAPFGRDGIIAALQVLWVQPAIARGVLAFLAATQARGEDADQDAQPGKILHEMRRGEMAALHEVPFGRYYGSVDATPLFVMLAGAYYQRTADLPFIESLWPHIEAALRWLETSGDPDGDGFVEYVRQTPKGLVNQGWKDSHNSIFHADGTLAEGPIALCEVQAYAYKARRAGAQLATALGHRARAEELLRDAALLRERFEQSFWCEELSTYALALDGAKRPCRVRTSNAGHCLLCGIAGAARARRTAETLLSADLYGGWGIRTVAEGEALYNPISYHNGSVWPHDNSLIAAGFSTYGFADLSLKVLRGMLDASAMIDLARLPELFCGFPRRPDEGPTLYPVACAPQAWSAGAAFLLMQACIGLSIDAVNAEASEPELQPHYRSASGRARVIFRGSVLPESVDWLRVSNLQVGTGTVDLLLQRHAHDVGLTVLRRQGDFEIVVYK